MSAREQPTDVLLARDPTRLTGESLWQGATSNSAREQHWLELLSSEGLFAVEARESSREQNEDARVSKALGVVASLEPTTGDPQMLAVYPDGDPEPTWVDRRTMRLMQVPRTSLAREADVVRAADLADRAQLALGEPVLVRYGTHANRLVITGVRQLSVRIRFANANYRETAALVAGASTLAPLSIDALARALRIEGERGEEPRVRRFFGRAYRVVDQYHTPWARGQRVPSTTLERVVRLGRQVTLSLTAARSFTANVPSMIAKHDGVSLADLDRRDLIAALENRMRLVTDAMGLLERSHLATLGLLPALEGLCGVVPREWFEALAAPQRAEERAELDRRLVRAAERSLSIFGELRLPPTALEVRDAAREKDGELLKEEWRHLRLSLQGVRMLGMDVRPQAMGASDEDLRQAVEEAYLLSQAGQSAGRARAKRALLKRVLMGPLRAAGVAPAGALLLLLDKLAQTKGTLAEGLAAALLCLRAGALEAGERLVAQGILERAEDTLYMPLDEIEEALDGELGAYAARVRLRREDDRRWRNFAAPRFIAARSS